MILGKNLRNMVGSLVFNQDFSGGLQDLPLLWIPGSSFKLDRLLYNLALIN